MNIFIINTKNYKTIYFQTTIPKVLVLIASWLLVMKGVHILYGFDPGKKLTLPILFGMSILATIHAQYQKKRLTSLQAIGDFDEKVSEYERFYRFRLLWFLVSSIVSCCLSLLTGKYLFLYFALFDIIVSLPYYPNIKMFKKELENEEIIFN